MDVNARRVIVCDREKVHLGSTRADDAAKRSLIAA
jgi:hypothetical protein